MTEETKTPTASSDPVTENPELKKLEQAVESEAVSEDSPKLEAEKPASDVAPAEGQAYQALAEKKGFKSADDMAKAYQNAESQNTRLAQEMRDLAKEVKQATAPQADDPFKDIPDDQRQALDLLGRVIDEKLDAKLQPLRSDMEVRSAQSEIAKVRESFPSVDDTQIQQAIGVVDKHPSLSLDDAVRIVTYSEAESTSKVTQAKVATDQQKKRAYVESGKTAKVADTIDYNKLSLEELEAILPKTGQFIDHKGVLRK